MGDERLAAARAMTVASRVVSTRHTRTIVGARLLPIIAALVVTIAGCTGDDPRPSAAPDLAATATTTATPFALPTPWTAPPPTPVGPATPPEDLAPEIPFGVPVVAPPPGVPSTLLDESGWPRGAVGPLVVFERFVSEDQRRVVGPNYSVGQTVTTVTEVVTYDLGARRQLAAFEVGSRNGPSIQLMGSKLLVNFHRSLWMYNLDGSEGVELAGGPDYARRIERVVPNADGSLIAINHFTDGPGPQDDNLIEVIDVRGGNVVMELAQLDLPEEFIGIGGPVDWTPDENAIVLLGYRYTEAQGSVALLTLDGDLTLSEERRTHNEVVDPTSQRPTVVYSGGLRACAVLGYNGVERIALVDPDGGRELAAIEARWPALGGGEWSPDGREMLVSRRDLGDEMGAAIRDAYVGPGCPESPLADEAWARPAEWFLLRIDEPHLIAVVDRRAALERWWGDRLVTFACGGEESPGEGRGGRSSPRFGDQDCSRGENEIRVGGELIGSGRRPRVLGFVGPEPEPAPAAVLPADLRADPIFVHHDPSVRTRVEAVDFVIEAMLAREPERLIDRIVGWEQRACFANWTGGSPGPPACPEGVADGTPVDSILVGDGGENRYLGRSELPEFARLAITLADEWGLYTVCARRPGADAADIEYVVLFGTPPGDGTTLITTSVTVTAEGITRINVGGFAGGLVEVWSTLDATPAAGGGLLPATTVADNFLRVPVDRRTGLEELDSLIETVLSRDTRGLAARAAFTEMECTTSLGVGFQPHCDDLGVPPGTIVEVLPAAAQEGFGITRPDFEETINILLGEELTFWAAYQAARPASSELERPDYVLVFLSTGPGRNYHGSSWQLHVKDGQIIFLEASFSSVLPTDEDIARWLIRPVPLA